MVPRSLFVLFLLTLPALAGCLETTRTVTDEAGFLTGPARGTQTGSMTAEVKGTSDRSGQENGKYVSERTIRIGGTENLNAMLVVLSSFNGDIDFTTGAGDAFEVTIVLKGRGDTASEARSRMEGMKLEWRHEEDGLHFFMAKVTSTLRTSTGMEASIRAKFPASTLYTLDLSTTNGEVEATGATTDGVRLRTTNGNVLASVKGTNVILSTTNGDADLQYVPRASGIVSLSTTNGGVDAKLKEGTAGYDVAASTTNGKARITLDGTTTESRKPYGGESISARTRDYDARSLQVTVTASTTNGNVAITGN